MDLGERYKRVVGDAKSRVEQLDAIDGGPECERHSLDLVLRTVMTALASGINHMDWGRVGDAMVMLQQTELKYRPAEQKGKGFYLDVK